VRWIPAAILGPVSSTFSTIVTTLGGARIGRDAATDWMVVAAIPLQDGVLQADPSWDTIAAGIAFHQWADFAWVLVFFGVFGRWTARLGPAALLAVGIPWAVFTSATEYFLIVPFWQPIFVLEQPYWIGLVVHLASASMYPLFPWLRDKVAGVPPRHRRFTYIYGVGSRRRARSPSAGSPSSAGSAARCRCRAATKPSTAPSCAAWPPIMSRASASRSSAPSRRATGACAASPA
jgi:hypothetical protein